MNTPRAAVGALYDSISPNTGDRAIGMAVSQELARHGVTPTRILRPFDDDPADQPLCVVGGGELIRPLGDPLYDRFRPRGPHVLNSVGVWEQADHLEYLSDYRLVSARSSSEVDLLRAVVPDAELVPCTTTTLESEPFPVPGLPDDGEPVVGIHVVPHTMTLCPELVEAVNAIPHRKVFIPFTHYNHDDSFMAALPFDRSNAVDLPRLTPNQLHSVIGQMTYVVVSSLHATIFAYSQQVPFATVDQLKVTNYLRDRDLNDLVFSDARPLDEVVRRLEEDPPDLSVPVERDKRAVHEWFARVAALVGGDHPGPVDPVMVEPEISVSQAEVELIATQREQVILGRDAVVARTSRRSSELYAEAARLADERNHLVADLEDERRRLVAEQSRSAGLENELEDVRHQLSGTLDIRLRSAGASARGALSRARDRTTRQKDDA